MMLHHIKTMLHHGELQLTGAQTEVAAALRRQHSDCPLVAHEDTIAQQAKRSNVTLTASKRLRRKTHEDVRGHNKLRPACTGNRFLSILLQTHMLKIEMSAVRTNLVATECHNCTHSSCGECITSQAVGSMQRISTLSAL